MIPPSIDVVIATHQRPDLLRRAIEGVTSQTYPGVIRCLVVFDRSSPDLSLVRTGPHRPVDVLTNTRTPGLAGARNSGILAGEGEQIDLLLPEVLEFASTPYLGTAEARRIVSAG